MKGLRAVLPVTLLAIVASYVLVLDAVAGPAERAEPTPVPVVTTTPRAGAVLCTVGVGGLGEPALQLPDAPGTTDPAGEPVDEDEDLDSEQDGEQDGEQDDEQDEAEEPSQDASQEASDAVDPATIIAARPDGVGRAPAQLERVDLLEGERAVASLPAVFPDSDARTSALRAEEPGASWLRWRDGAVAVTREWRVEGVDGLPTATVLGGCPASAAGTHVVPGMSTVGGDEARLRLANPHETPASVAVRFATPGDAEAPLVLQNLSVPAGSVREVVVNTTLPERADLAALVEVTSGRLAVEGIQLARAAIGGIDGATLLAATTAPAENWTVPWLVDNDDTAAWLWIVNRGERTAAVELTLHTEDGGGPPDGLGEVSVPAGEMRRVDLTGTFPEDVTEVAATARSNGVPIVVSGGVARSADEVARTGTSVQLGVASDTRWVVSGTSNEVRRERLRLVNPEGEPAMVSITLFDGVRAIAPEELQDLELSAGSTRTVPLDELLSPTARWSAFVTAEQGRVVVGRVGSDGGDGPLHLVAGAGVPAATWTTTGSGLQPVVQPGLVTQLGTTGPRAPEGDPGSPADEGPGSQQDPGTLTDPDGTAVGSGG